MINPGKMKEKITIQKLCTEMNKYGDTVETWKDICTVHAYINGLYGDELYEARKYNQEQSVTVETRYNKALADIAPQDCRIIWRKNEFKIIPPIDNFQFLNQTLKFKMISKSVGDKNEQII